MLMNEIPVKQDDGYITILYPHYTEAVPKGTVLILHGMAEHHARYHEFTAFLNHCGYDVFLYDHRGHGTDKKLEELGIFSEKDGDVKVTTDVIHLIHFIRKNCRNKNIFLFAHSMGSLIARNVIQHEDSIAGLILCGTTQLTPAALTAGQLVSSAIRAVKGHDYVSEFMHKLMFPPKKFDSVCERTKFDWLTRNQNIVGQYMHDGFCGYTCSIGLYNDVIKILKNITTPYLVRHTRKDLPIYIISGKNDPVGNFGNDIYHCVSMFQKLNFTAIECTIYAESRHELLNELNQKEVMLGIMKWLNKTGDAANNSNPSEQNLTEEDSIDNTSAE